MAFGMNTSGGNFLDIVKYDSRAGRMFRVDRDMNNDKTQTDITSADMQFAVDFGTLEVGFVAFTASGPVRAMVPYDGRPLPSQPQDKDAEGKIMSRPGFRLLIAGKAVGGIREWCSNASILVNEIEVLWDMYRVAPEAAQGRIPLVSIISTVPVTSGRGAQKSTNYKPVFVIRGWVDRLEDMGPRTVPVPRPVAAMPHVAPRPTPGTQGAPAAPLPETPAPAQAATRPSGASTGVAAPDAMPFGPEVR